MVIDSHQHFWKYNPVRDSWITDEMHVLKSDFLPDDLMPLLAKNNLDGTVAVQADQSETETMFLVELSERYDIIKGVVGWVDLCASNLHERLDYFKGFPKLKGFRHVIQAEPDGFMMNPLFVNGVKTLGEFGFTYDLLIYHHQLAEALAFVQRVPTVNIVVDHLAKPSIRTGEKTHWELNMATMATFSNVKCKISGMVTEASWNSWKKEDFFPYLDELMETFGPSRLMYGSDWPVCLLAASYDEQIQIVHEYISQLSESEREGIMGKNASSFYKL